MLQQQFKIIDNFNNRRYCNRNTFYMGKHNCETAAAVSYNLKVITRERTLMP